MRVRKQDILLSYKGEYHEIIAISSHLFTHKTLITTKYIDRRTGKVGYVTFPATVMKENVKFEGKMKKRFVRIKDGQTGNHRRTT